MKQTERVGTIPTPDSAISPRPSSRRPWIIAGLTIAGLLVLALLTTFVVRSASGPERTTGGSLKNPTGAAAAVREYLEAVAAGDAEKAMTTLDRPPVNAPLLTDEVLMASLKTAPLTDISVPTPASGAKSVRATYRIGGRQITTEYFVTELAGSPKVIRGWYDLDLSILTDGIPVRINGVDYTSGLLMLFPGTYTVSSAHPAYAFGTEATFVVEDSYGTTDISLNPRLSATGREQAAAAVMRAIDTCLAAKTLAAGCGLDLEPVTTDGSTIVEGSVRRSITQTDRDTLKDMDPEVDLADHGRVTVTLHYVPIREQVTVTKNGKRSEGELEASILDTGFGRPSVAMTGKDLVVTWE